MKIIISQLIILQHGEGSRPCFIVESETTRCYHRFRYEGREIRGRLAAHRQMRSFICGSELD